MSYLHGIGLATGPAIPLAQAAGADEDPKTVLVLAQEGFSEVAIDEEGLVALARRAMSETLERAAVDPLDVDAVVLATESFWDVGAPKVEERQRLEHLRLRDALLETFAGLGLARACPYGAWLSACGNLGVSLGLSHAMVAAGQHQRILVVTVDRQRPDLPRFMRGGAAVLGDAAASCLVGTEPRSGFRIEAVRSVGAPGVAQLDPRKDFSRLVLETHKSVRRLDRDFTAVIGAPLREAQHVLAGHFHVDALKVIADTLKLPAERLRREGRAAYGHLDASDNLVTLRALDDQGQIAEGDLVVLLNTGVWTWSAVALRKTA
ncbi:hypothetical protein ASD38_20740 [Caulobacter sp. Root487D2Y]|jgi:3-oxoacyl-[acyl-carrier-protein] synthase-3|uniref:3-oxoacyl-[acyl-carrier-protein] synthase III C-terminal domain-containing protein n=1 Tax=Caulobacter sp. Root487D2Y TaxID=1736547 RepID=UPI0006FD4A32|nr:3-oxoacyl-[acyl-carrier-protein] synthase III C-terminal domain-containing protein [Caulobacter sp. Root487D2Y]KQY26171.1 hypothetical protein ASD38_20740 [Caulobacter sp. Root487D2Y]